MTALRRLFLWYGLLSKRLLRRPAYLAVLLLVPLFCLAILFFSRQESGVVTVALYCADPADSAAGAARQRLLDEESIIRYIPFDDEAQARDAVIHGRADAAWLFRADTGDQLDRFVRKGGGVAVTVVEREDNVFLMISREKLFAALYPDLSFSVFSQYLVDIGGSASDNLDDYYASASTTQQVLRFTAADGDELGEPGHYLVAPLRGILSLLLMLSGFASAMYCYREERNGSFVWLSQGKRSLLPILCHLTAILPAALAVYAAMALAGILTAPLRELLMLFLFSLGAALFCELVRCLAGRPEHLGALIPILMIAMLVLCPVFLDLPILQPLRLLFPPYYYLRSAYSLSGLLALAAYAAVLAVITLPAARFRQARL
ncbi:MAG: hypothetical protein II069_03795 [Oscillospiraceae bacterium]|nr:hypothetical protein [Oscillospiraceae bacterium]